MKLLMASGDDSAKKGTQLSLTEESHINKESEKQSRSRYKHLFLNVLLLAGLRTFALIVSAHPYCARKSTCHAMPRHASSARAKS